MTSCAGELEETILKECVKTTAGQWWYVRGNRFRSWLLGGSDGGGQMAPANIEMSLEHVWTLH